MNCKLCFYIVAFLFFENYSCTLVYRYNSTQLTWDSARDDCLQRGGDLVNGSFQQQLYNCTFPQNTNFWVGTYNEFSQWIQIMGCSQMDTSGIVNQYTSDSPHTCVDNCNKFFGMMDNSCYCLPDNYSWETDQSQVNDSMCNKTCGENMQDSCGGNEYITVYKRVPNSIVLDRIDEPDKNSIMCGCMECTNNGWLYYGYSCNQSLQTTCNDKSEIEDNRNWNEGKEACWSDHQSFLLAGTINDLQCVNTTSRAPMWIGLYRRKRIQVVKEEKSSVSAVSCFHGMLTAGVLSIDSNLNCTAQLPFICELDTEDVLSSDCYVYPPEHVTTELTTVEEGTTQTKYVDLTTPASGTSQPKKLTDDNDDISPGAAVGIAFAVVLPTLLVIGTIICHVACGQKPTERKPEDKVELRKKEEYYIRPSSEMSEINIRYSLFEQEPDNKESDSGIGDNSNASVSYEKSRDGHVSTFITIPKVQAPNGPDIEASNGPDKDVPNGPEIEAPNVPDIPVVNVLVNDDDLVTKL
ncbi:uncharacterized protein LOC134706186 [Mytilus trossulus]|uniref:uncharacterized protein LOC134706186 n=1 Tax=Mytilus trossulus TaxID=6551 RepID=UPI003003CEF5